MTWQKAIQKVLTEANEALNCSEITEKIITQGLRNKKDLGATPAATVGAQISKSIKYKGEESPYIRVARGEFTLRKDYGKNIIESTKTSQNEEEKKFIIGAFGMFWQRSKILWKNETCLLGRYIDGGETVNFNQQRGIYLLYDGREIIYVGRSTDRPLGMRLFEHTKDRHAGRWNRFSWFGLRGVSEKGELIENNCEINEDLIISSMESLLIESLEPRQNRKRGDEWSTIEYLQVEDPQIEKQRKKNILSEMAENI